MRGNSYFDKIDESAASYALLVRKEVEKVAMAIRSGVVDISRIDSMLIEADKLMDSAMIGFRRTNHALRAVMTGMERREILE